MVVIDNKKEVEHLIQVITQTQRALEQSDAFQLHQLSDQTIHTASIHQHTDLITIATLIYSLNKLVTRKDRMNKKAWDLLVKKFNAELEKSIRGLKESDSEEFTRHLDHAKELLESYAGKSMHAYVQDIFKKASINKATKLYEHGVSLARTAHLLGLTQWELLDYVGQRGATESPFSATLDEKKRAEAALKFFS